MKSPSIARSARVRMRVRTHDSAGSLSMGLESPTAYGEEARVADGVRRYSDSVRQARRDTGRHRRADPRIEETP